MTKPYGTVTRQQLEAALPEAPTGFFWKLKRDDIYLRVELRRKWWIGSTYAFGGDAEPTAISVSNEARDILRWVDNEPQRKREEARRKADLKRISGNYGLRKNR